MSSLFDENRRVFVCGDFDIGYVLKVVLILNKQFWKLMKNLIIKMFVK